MTLFSWFVRRTSVNSARNNNTSLEQELSTFNNNTMWPLAKVRTNTLIQQQQYIRTTSHLQQASKVGATKEQSQKSQVN